MDAIIPLLRDYFKDQPVLRAYLFGSYARSSQDERSDLDILVEFDPLIVILSG